MNKKELQEYISDTYSVSPDFPWTSYPSCAVYRHGNNRKWFALVMDIPKQKLGISGDGLIDILNVKCDPIMIGSFRLEPGIYPAYHMNKESWLSIALDGSADDGKIKLLLDISFDLTSKKLKKRTAKQQD